MDKYTLKIDFNSRIIAELTGKFVVDNIPRVKKFTVSRTQSKSKAKVKK